MTFRTFALVLALSVSTSSRVANAQDVPTTKPTAADAMLAEFEAIRPPSLEAEKLGDQAYTQDVQARQKKVLAQRADLAWRFYEQFPDHPKAGGLLLERWMVNARQNPDQALAEVQQVLDRAPAVPAR